jgi:RNA polymerase sigma-70 factor (ECF subfamily)
MTRTKNRTAEGHLDQAKFELLFREFFPPLLAFSRRILGDEEDAREVVQQVFIKLWEKREGLDLETSLKSYLFTAVHHRSLNVIRDRKRFTDSDLPDRATDVDVSQQMEHMELEDRIGEVIAALPEKCREVFELNRFEGLKYGEIAQQLGISVKTVENQMSKALRILREKLARYLAIVLWLIFHSN